MPDHNRVDPANSALRQPADTTAISPFAALTWIGEVLTLQLLFVVASLPIVTVLPAALALQRSLYELLAMRCGRPVATFVRNLEWSLRRFWMPGLLLALGMTVGVIAFLFWASVPTALGWLGLGVLGGLAVATLISYVALLAAAMSAQLTIPDADRRAVIDLAFDLVRRRLPQLAVAAFLIMGWLVVQLRLPTLVLVGNGLIPALITWLLVARTKAPTTALRHRDGTQR